MNEHVNFLHVNRLRMFENVWYVWKLDPVQNSEARFYRRCRHSPFCMSCDLHHYQRVFKSGSVFLIKRNRPVCSGCRFYMPFFGWYICVRNLKVAWKGCLGVKTVNTLPSYLHSHTKQYNKVSCLIVWWCWSVWWWNLISNPCWI